MQLLSSDARNTMAFANSLDVSSLSSGTLLKSIFKRCLAATAQATRLFSPSVSRGPGFTAFSRMRVRLSPLSMSAHTPARRLLRRYKHYSSAPALLATMEAFRMIDVPSDIRRSVFCTVNFHVDVEERVIVLLSYFAESGNLHSAQNECARELVNILVAGRNYMRGHVQNRR